MALSAFNALQNAIERDLKTATLPPDAKQDIVSHALNNHFRKQMRHWMSQISALDDIDIEFGEVSGLVIDHELQNQAAMLAKQFDKYVAILETCHQGPLDVSYQQMKADFVESAQLDLLRKWIWKWETKRPYETYLLQFDFSSDPVGNAIIPSADNTPNPGITPAPGYSNDLQQKDINNETQWKNSSNHVNALGVGVPQDVNAFSANNIGPDFEFLGLPDVIPENSFATYDAPGENSQLAAALNSSVMPSLATPMDSAIDINTPAPVQPSPATAVSSSKGKMRSRQARPVDEMGVAYGRYDIFSEKPSSANQDIVFENTSLQDIFDRYPNHLTLHHVSLRLGNDETKKVWTNKRITTLLMSHESEHKGNYAEIYRWVRNQRAKGTQHDKGMRNAERKKQGMEVEPKYKWADTTNHRHRSKKSSQDEAHSGGLNLEDGRPDAQLAPGQGHLVSNEDQIVQQLPWLSFNNLNNFQIPESHLMASETLQPPQAYRQDLIPTNAANGIDPTNFEIDADSDWPYFTYEETRHQ